MTENTFRTGYPCLYCMDKYPRDYRVKPVEPEHPSAELVNYGRWMAAQAMIDEALKALGQTDIMRRVEDLECLVADCQEALRDDALIARCKEALK